MKKYIKPTMDSEVFVTNEFIAACWGVACITSEAAKIEKSLGNTGPLIVHRDSQCGQFDHQYIFTDANNKAIGMEERKHDLWNSLKCTVYSDEKYRNEIEDLSTITSGQTIYWKTSSSGLVYHHVGVVQYTDANRVNASV